MKLLLALSLALTCSCMAPLQQTEARLVAAIGQVADRQQQASAALTEQKALLDQRLAAGTIQMDEYQRELRRLLEDRMAAVSGSWGTLRDETVDTFTDLREQMKAQWEVFKGTLGTAVVTAGSGAAGAGLTMLEKILMSVLGGTALGGVGVVARESAVKKTNLVRDQRRVLLQERIGPLPPPT